MQVAWRHYRNFGMNKLFGLRFYSSLSAVFLGISYFARDRLRWDRSSAGSGCCVARISAFRREKAPSESYLHLKLRRVGRQLDYKAFFFNFLNILQAGRRQQHNVFVALLNAFLSTRNTHCWGPTPWTCFHLC